MAGGTHVFDMINSLKNNKNLRNVRSFNIKNIKTKRVENLKRAFTNEKSRYNNKVNIKEGLMILLITICVFIAIYFLFLY